MSMKNKTGSPVREGGVVHKGKTLPEDKTKKSGQKFEDLIESFSSGVLIAYDDQAMYTNTTLAKLTGYSKNELLTPPFSQFFHPEDREKALRIHRARINGEDAPGVYDCRLNHKDGHFIWIRLRAFPIEWKSGFAFFYWFCNINDKVQFEKRQMNTQQHMASIFEMLPDPTFVVDMDGAIIAWNRAMARLTGLPPEDVSGKTSRDFIIPNRGKTPPALLDYFLISNDEARAEFEKYYPDIIKIEDSIFVERRISVGGEQRWYHMKANPLYDADRKRLGVIESIRDITDRKQVEEALRESEERYRTVIEHSNDGIAVLQDDTHIYVNRRFCEIFGYDSPAGVIGQTNEATVHPDDLGKVREHRLKQIQGMDVPYNYEFRGLRKDGTVVDLEASSTPTRYKGDLFALALFRDITERKQAFYELQKHRKQLSEANTALKVLLRQRENDRKELEERLSSNLRELILPHVTKLKRTARPDQKGLLNVISGNLGKIMSSFPRTIKHLGLTPRETEVASLIKDGKTTKEIANFMGIGLRAIDSHRDNIRKKFGLSGRKINLRSYLIALDDE